MRQREFERDLLNRHPQWRRLRAVLAATCRHHPEDAEWIDTLRAGVAIYRRVAIVKELHRLGVIDALTTVEMIGPDVCSDIKPSGDWGIAG